MNSVTKEIINALLVKYENSAYFKEEKSNRRILLNSNNDLFKKAFINPSSYKYKDEVTLDLNKLIEKEYIYLTLEKYTFNILEIVLNLNKVNELYKEINRINPKDEANELLAYLLNILDKYKDDEVLINFINDEINYINLNKKYKKKYYKDLDELKVLIKLIHSLLINVISIKERDFSVKVLGDSKLFNNYKTKVISILKDYDTKLINELNESELINDLDVNSYILEFYNVYKNSTYVLIKNNLVFKLNDQIIDLNKLKYEYSLSDEMILNLELLDSKFNKVITIENLTSFYEYKDDDALIIYLAGFHNHTKKMLLKKIYDKYPNVNYYHFGDIDIGGFRIFIHLVESTKIPFKPLKMGVDELKDIHNNLKELTVNDKKALDLMLPDDRYIMFIDVMKYMKVHNVKLEQENLD